MMLIMWLILYFDETFAGLVSCEFKLSLNKILLI